MNADAFFTIGSTHKVCQDYALAGKDYALLSDGCSSGGDTDFGSRLMCQAGKKYINSTTPRMFFDGTILKSSFYALNIDMNVDCLLATVMAVRVCPTSPVYEVLIAGDGVIAAKHKTEGLFVATFDFESGAPYYLRYCLDTTARKRYCEQFGSWIKRTSFIIKPDGKEETGEYPEDRWEGEKEHKYEDTGDFGRFVHTFSMEEFEFVAVMSDGVKSFYQQKRTDTSVVNETIPLNKIVPELVGFKNFNGEFVQRRCIKAFAKFREQGWHNADDVSVAVLTNK